MATLIDVFGDFWTARSFCERRFWRSLFRRLSGYGPSDDEKLRNTVNALLAKEALAGTADADAKAAQLTDRILHLVRGRLRAHTLTTKQSTQLRSAIEKQTAPDPLVFSQGNIVVHQQGHSPVSHADMYEGLEQLLEMGVLRLGIEKTCPTCKLTTWHPVNELSEHVTCVGCGTGHSLGPAEQWSYTLNTLAQRAVSQGILAVVHALAALASHSHGFFVFSPSLELFRRGNQNPSCELDILCVAEGDFVIGEVKEGHVQKKDFDRLADIAEIILPQRAIIFLPLEHATKQADDLNTWLAETRSRLAQKNISGEIFTLPEY